MAPSGSQSSDASSLTERKSRRALLALLGAGGAAAVASAIPSRIARAGHDGTNTFHLGQQNTATEPTSLDASLTEGKVLTVRGDSGSGAIHAEFNSLSNPGAAIECVAPGPGVALQSFGTIRAFGHFPDEDGEFLGPGEGVHAQSEVPEAAAVWGESVFVQERGGPGLPPPLGIGVLGTTGTGTGVIGRADTTGFTGFTDGTGVLGQSGTGDGVRGESQTGAAISGSSESGHGLFVGSVSGRGVDATCDSGPGVLGWSPEGVGVVGIGSLVRGLGTVPEVAPGVLGIAPGAAAAVRCVSGGLVPDEGSMPIPAPDSGLALDVVGTARFMTAGNDAVEFGQNSRFVVNGSVTALSHISLTLHGDPGPRQLKWVERNPGSGFTVHFAGGPPGQRPEVPFSYIIIEPAS